MKVTAWPAGFRVATVVAVDRNLVVAAGLHGNAAELVTLKGTAMAREPIAVTATGVGSAAGSGAGVAAGAGAAKLGTGSAQIVSIVADKSGRVVVAAKDGQLAVRDKYGSWSMSEVRSELPPDRPGSPPAESKSGSSP